MIKSRSGLVLYDMLKQTPLVIVLIGQSPVIVQTVKKTPVSPINYTKDPDWKSILNTQVFTFTGSKLLDMFGDQSKELLIG